MTKDELKQEAEEYLKRKLEERKNKLVIELPEVYITDLQQAYLASAEPREKRIADLEEKNEQLTDQLCNVANNLLDNWCRNEDDYCPHLDKLEKENAELKDFLKGVIEVFVTAPTQFSERQKKDLLEDIEQFLSEVEK